MDPNNDAITDDETAVMPPDGDHMTTVSFHSFSDPQYGEDSFTIKIIENMREEYGMFVWPSSILLAEYVWQQRKRCSGISVVELGAGTSLPGLVAAKVGADVTLTDDVKKVEVLENIRGVCDLNGLHCKVNYAHSHSLLCFIWLDVVHEKFHSPNWGYQQKQMQCNDLIENFFFKIKNQIIFMYCEEKLQTMLPKVINNMETTTKLSLPMAMQTSLANTSSYGSNHCVPMTRGVIENFVIPSSPKFIYSCYNQAKDLHLCLRSSIHERDFSQKIVQSMRGPSGSCESTYKLYGPPHDRTRDKKMIDCFCFQPKYLCHLVG